MDTLRKIGRWLAPPAQKAEDGRDVWPSRASFLLAAMGGCAGMGNLLRYPSQIYNNNGLQWFIPYLMAIFLIAIPALILEIAIGQAYRGGSVVAFNNINHRLKGAGLSLLYVGFVVGPYFVVNLAWIMNYFRNSFTSPLPWTGRGQEFYMDDVVANVDPIVGNLTASGDAVANYTVFPGVGMVGETVGWTAFTWFLVWISIFKGVGLTGRVVYFTMGLPIVITIVLIGRATSLDNAAAGIKLMWAEWHSDKLASGDVWQTACGQVFFSTGVGFGYFTSYASYNRKHSNAVVDAMAIVASNVLFENVASFTVFGVVGFLELWPKENEPLGSFTVGFLTLPLAVTEMPGANFWAVALFFTLMVLGFSSAFAMLDAVVTLVMDSGVKWSRPMVVTTLTIISFLLSLPYCTEFGYYLLEGIDKWTNDVALVFVVFTECVSSTTLYRWRDVVGQVGLPSFLIYNFGYIGGMIIGVTVAHTVSAEAGAGAGFGVYIVCSIVSSTMGSIPGRLGSFSPSTVGKTPDADTPKLFSRSVITSRFWWLAFYSGNQLRRDLNEIVAQGKNWKIPAFWGVLLRYVSAPVLAIIFSFSYPSFYQIRYEPLHILGFGVGHIALLIIGLGFIVPRWFEVLIPPSRRGEGHLPYAPGVTLDPDDHTHGARPEPEDGMSGDNSSADVPHTDEKKADAPHVDRSEMEIGDSSSSDVPQHEKR